MKQITKRFSILAIILSVSLGALMSCASSRETMGANDRAARNTEQSKAFNHKQTENTLAEDKTSTETAQKKLVEIYDGRQELKKSKLNIDEAETVEDAVRAKAAEIKKINNDSCEGDDKFSTSSVEGAFTKPNVKQNAYLYTLCNDGSATSPGVIGGIVIVEAGKPVAIYTLKYYGSMDFVSLPDINKNGLTEIGLLQTDGGQGLQGTTLSIYEYNKAGEIATLGGTDASTVSFNSKNSSETAYKISVEPSAKPIFYRETYVKKDGAKDWSLSKKSEKVSLDEKAVPQPTLNSVD